MFKDFFKRLFIDKEAQGLRAFLHTEYRGQYTEEQLNNSTLIDLKKMLYTVR